MEKGRISVVVRVRPLNDKERHAAGRARPVVRPLDEQVLIFDPSDDRSPVRGVPSYFRRSKEIRFGFDRVFDQNAGQVEVFQESTQPLLDPVLNGYNATVLAYGATGAGKTHTMVGNPHSGPGVMVLTMRDLFSKIESLEGEKACRVAVSYLEVYNETIRDLLSPASTPHGLDLREDPSRGAVVSNLSQHFPTSSDEVMQLLQEGNARRSVSPTEANATSSRSHAVLQVVIQQSACDAGIEKTVGIGKLLLVDLAGSERAAVTKNRGSRLKEGANINKSLLALGNCINALGDGRKGTYIPYRNSKLTRLLKDSLGGNCRTVMIANVSPSAMTYDDTLNTLKYASRAKHIKTQVRRNVINVKSHISEYTTIIGDLKQQVQSLKQQLATAAASAPSAAASLDAMDWERDRQTSLEIRAEIHRFFEERRALKTTIAERRDAECKNRIKIKELRGDIERWETSPGDFEPGRVETHLAVMRKNVQALAKTNAENARERVAAEKRLDATAGDHGHLQELCSLVKCEERREFLLRELRLCLTELDKIDLEAECAQRDMELDDLHFTANQNAANMQTVLSLWDEQLQVLKDNGLWTQQLEDSLQEAKALCKTTQTVQTPQSRKLRLKRKSLVPLPIPNFDAGENENDENRDESPPKRTKITWGQVTEVEPAAAPVDTADMMDIVTPRQQQRPKSARPRASGGAHRTPLASRSNTATSANNLGDVTPRARKPLPSAERLRVAPSPAAKAQRVRTRTTTAWR